MKVNSLYLHEFFIGFIAGATSVSIISLLFLAEITFTHPAFFLECLVHSMHMLRLF
ncbi:hypothetical protein SAMN05216516_102275 [Izhakiella capsodis]|uniref:Uncharacterized protein n=1 Tax=Izhakiella capsodis TaxID=1367852 RepID=A0A1I4W5F4_9GAMM|nr:hypothetical protein SAMN05216516_102275 [Izhakiella capsodis]